MVLKDKKKFQCGDSHKGLLQPPRGSKELCAEAEGAIENLTIRPGHPNGQIFDSELKVVA